MAKRDDALNHPTRDEYLGLAEAVGRGIVWGREQGLVIDDDFAALHTAKLFVAGGADDAELLKTANALVDLSAHYAGVPPAHPHVTAHRKIREAVRAMVGIARHARVDADTYRGWRQQVIEHVVVVGTTLHVTGAQHQIEIAVSTAPITLTAPEAKDGQDPLTLRVRGEVLALLRERAKITREDVVVRLKAQGVTLTTNALARVEGGTGRAELPLDALARAVGSSERAVLLATDRALLLAEQMAGTSIGVDVTGPSWYGRAEAAFGERYARALLLVAAVAALRPEPAHAS